MAANTELNIILRDAAKTPLLRMTAKIASHALKPGRREFPSSIRPEHELAVAFKVRPGPHVELAVVADEKQRPFRHLSGSLQQGGGVVGAHLVGKGLAVLVVAIAH